jgi:hypothetical protein
MYCFCTAGMPIRAILAISEDVIRAMREPLQLLFFQYLWQNDGGFSQGAGRGGTVRGRYETRGSSRSGKGLTIHLTDLRSFDPQIV